MMKGEEWRFSNNIRKDGSDPECYGVGEEIGKVCPSGLKDIRNMEERRFTKTIYRADVNDARGRCGPRMRYRDGVKVKGFN